MIEIPEAITLSNQINEAENENSSSLADLVYGVVRC
jgi:hypothetical protein